MTNLEAKDSKDPRFGSPEKTLAYWTKAVNKQNWQHELDCYEGRQRARFTYFLILCTRELQDSPDLIERLNTVLKNHRFPSRILEAYPSQRSDLSHLTDPNEIQNAIAEHTKQLELQIEKWEQDIQSYTIDWGTLAHSLQPLFQENFKRHSDFLHPSHTGIIRHLSFYQVKRASILQSNNHRAEGSLVFVPRDPNVISQQDEEVTKPRPKGLKGFTQRIRDYKFWNPDTQLQHQGEVTLQPFESGWKIVAVPYR